MADEPWMDVNPMLWDQARELRDKGRDDKILLYMDNIETWIGSVSPSIEKSNRSWDI